MDNQLGIDICFIESKGGSDKKIFNGVIAKMLDKR